MDGLYHGWFLDYLDVVGEPDPAGDLGGLTAGSEQLSTSPPPGVVTRSAPVMARPPPPRTWRVLRPCRRLPRHDTPRCRGGRAAPLGNPRPAATPRATTG